MTIRTLTTAAIAIAALLVTAFPASAQTPIAAGAWSVTDDMEITLDGDADIASLSPDGAWIAGQGENDSFCIWSTDDGTETCAGEDLPIDLRSIAWAPDSSAVAFSLDAARLLIDSDIYVLDVESGDLENLTDDPGEARRVSFSGEPGEYIHADIMPAWSPDGETIAFVRGTFDEWTNSTSIMTIAPGSGNAGQLFLLSPLQWLTVYSPMHYLPDDSLLIAVAMADPDVAANGVWHLAPDGGRIDQLLQTAPNAGELAGTTIVDVSADGSQAILFSAIAYSVDPFTISPYYLLDIATGELSPLPAATDEEMILPDPVFVGTSNDIASLARSAADDRVTLAIDGEPVLDDLEIAGGGVAAILFASEDGHLFVRQDHGAGRLITLEEEVPAPCACTPPA